MPGVAMASACYGTRTVRRSLRRIYKDRKKVSGKYWNSSGEEVATEEEAEK